MGNAWKDRTINVGEEPDAFLTVSTHPDAPEDMMRLKTGHTDESQEEYGDVDIAMTLDFAEALSEALIEMVTKMREEREEKNSA